MTYCEAEKCRIKGQHLDVDGHNDECAGCQPRQAEHGKLCEYHWTWLNRNLADTPALVEEILANREPSTAGNYDERVKGGNPAEQSPLAVGAVDDADELYALLVIVTQACSPQIQQPGPIETVWASEGYTRGIKAGTNPADARTKTQHLVSWLRRHLHEIAPLDDVLTLTDELAKTVPRLKHRYPIAEQARHLPGARCRQCKHLDLWWTPPAGEAWPITVQCHTCDYVAPENEFHRFARLVEYEQSTRRTA